jgi:hypothetical protein
MRGRAGTGALNDLSNNTELWNQRDLSIRFIFAHFGELRCKTENLPHLPQGMFALYRVGIATWTPSLNGSK